MKSLKKIIRIALMFVCYDSVAQIFEPALEISRPYIELPQKVISVDVDNDGLLDLVIASYPPENICWFKNIGNGVFGDKQLVYSAPPAASEYSSPITYSVLSKDVDQDGDADLIAYDCLFFPQILFVETILQQCYWIENLGEGNFGEKHIINVDTSVLFDYYRNFFLADFDGDGLEDLIYGTNSTWNKFLGSGNWANAETILYNDLPFSGNYFLEDINNDGASEIIGSRNSKLIIGVNNGEGQIDSIIQLTDYNMLIDDLAYTDLDQDSLKDLVVCQKNGGDCYFYLLKKLSNDQFSDTIPIYQQTIGSDGVGELEASDFNNDGLIDLVLFTDRICLLIGTGNAQFLPPVFYCGIGRNVISADFNNDNLDDLIGLENELDLYSSITLKKFDLTNLFYNTESICFDDYSLFPNFTDIDLDGDLDIYFKWGWYECINTNPIEYSRFKYVTKGLFSNYRENIVGVFDFNNDGLKDFIVQRNQNDSLKILLNNISGIYTDVIYFQLPFNISIRSFIEFDFNLDVMSDFVIFATYNSGNESSTLVLFYKKNSQGLIELVDSQNTDISLLGLDVINYIKTFDINEDGLPDLLHSSNNGLACFINLGNEGFDNPNYLTDETTYNFFIEDINNDNILDLIYAGDSISTIRIKQGLGNGIFTDNTSILVNNVVNYSFTLNDFDLDGDPDIIATGLTPLAIDSSNGNGTSWGVYYKQNNNGQFQSDSLIAALPFYAICFSADIETDLDFDLFLNFGYFTKYLFINSLNIVNSNQIALVENNLTLFPNPFSNALNIKFTQNQERVDIQIYSIEGKLLKESNFKNIESTQFGLELNEGTYLVRIKTNNEITTKKIIKIKP